MHTWKNTKLKAIFMKTGETDGIVKRNGANAKMFLTVVKSNVYRWVSMRSIILLAAVSHHKVGWAAGPDTAVLCSSVRATRLAG